jgi:exopolysaccharide biosynthesis protein
MPGMNASPRFAWLLLLVGASAGAGDWEPVVAGVEYRHLQRVGLDAHVVRVDLDRRSLEVVATAAAERGLAVSEFARSRSAVVAVNGDYFDPSLNPVGLAMGNGTVWWQAAAGVRRQEVLGVGPGRARIFPRAEPLREPKRWMTGAVAGWPMVVEDCAPVTTLPGSAHFTLAPHPRTAVGLSKDRRELLLVVADGRREGVPGLTLPELAALLVDVGACTALNLDGGGSSALWLLDRIVNQPSDGFERKVANHLGVVEVRRKR